MQSLYKIKKINHNILLYLYLGRKVTLDNIGIPLMHGFTYTVLDLIVNLSFDIVLYSVLAVYIDNIYPGEYGIALPWNYPIIVCIVFG